MWWFQKKLCWPTKNKLKREKNLRESSWFSSLVRCCICDNPSENFPADQVTSFSSCSNPSFFSLPMLQNGERYLASNQRVKQGTERHRTQTSQLFRWFLSFFTNQGQKPKVNVLFLILIIFFSKIVFPRICGLWSELYQKTFGIEFCFFLSSLYLKPQPHFCSKNWLFFSSLRKTSSISQTKLFCLKSWRKTLQMSLNTSFYCLVNLYWKFSHG